MSVPTFKLIIVGDGATGKTTYVQRHVSGEFRRQYIATIGVEVRSLPFYTSQGEVHFEVYDTAGQEKFGGLRDGYYVNAKACFLFFDVTSRNTYKNVENWYNDVVRIVQDIPMVLVGNKCDQKNREVRTQSVSFHRNKGIDYVEISAKSNYNYEVPFLIICKKLANDPTLSFTQAPALIPAEIQMTEQDKAQINDALNQAANVALPDDDE
ncbi:GTP-binding nuclear protein RAN/TC4 [Spironucleus salmonicida]|uniref:GTP-binding nuclear protein n=1 Tax=Spironucleus salmonicida TaxID=348837 RepID=V6LIF4_9EUKA|nr:GTP-binding nuclear protein RAN/TC4 [Spironucleus salmonicida]KAH0570955.1 GTP-binding nuclear protein RAN/TC4 [Spironucleus salmonicida]|eukprot:EST44322.1 Small GTP-binding domain-containing protein [Spironucleus salmonicida]